MKRFLVEFAMGTDLHGQDVTKAACKAVRNAISNCCLCGISDCLGIDDLENHMHIHVKLGSTNPEGIDVEKVKAELPLGTVTRPLSKLSRSVFRSVRSTRFSSTTTLIFSSIGTFR